MWPHILSAVFSKQMSEEYQSFRRHFANLSESIQNPKTLASRLYSAGLLSRERRNNISSLQLSVEQIGQLLDAVEGQIKVDFRNFYKFVDELEKDSPMRHLCDKMRSTCGEPLIILCLKWHQLSSHAMVLCVDQLKSHIPEPMTQEPPPEKSGKILLNFKVYKNCHSN